MGTREDVVRRLALEDAAASYLAEMNVGEEVSGELLCRAGAVFNIAENCTVSLFRGRIFHRVRDRYPSLYRRVR